MPRPITKKDIKELRESYGSRRLKVLHDDNLGIVIYDRNDNNQGCPWAYRCFRYGMNNSLLLSWVSDRTFKRRKKLGHPKPRGRRFKQVLKDPDFGLDELTRAEEIMEGLK